MGDHRTGRPARWPRGLVLLAAVVYVVVLVTYGQVAPEPDHVPPVAPAPAVIDPCAPAVTSYPDGSTWYRCAPTTPPPAELPSADPFREE